MSALATTTSSISNSSEYKGHALVSYILLAIGLFTAIPLLFGAIWAMIQKSDAYGTIYHSHLVNVTRVFWWSLFWMIIGAIFIVVGVGFLVWCVTWLWVLYRVVNGLVKVLADEPYPL
ncbi:MAG: hypothetical protein JKX81_15790 [Arenicella sp.]|nr:hypothetical protein [Arenicella sp.]